MQLSKKLADGSMVTRKIILRDDQPEEVFFETSLTCGAEKPQAYQFRIQPEFSTEQISNPDRFVSAISQRKNLGSLESGRIH